MPSEEDAEIITIEGQEITKSFALNAAGETVASYSWMRDGVFFNLYGLTSESVSEQELEKMITSMLD